MSLSRSGKLILVLLVVSSLVLVLQVSRLRQAPDPLRQPTESYPHVNASNTFRLDPGWPVHLPSLERGDITGVAVDATDRVWVLGLGKPPVRLYDAQGNYVRGWGTGQIESGHQIRLDQQGHVWVADAGNHCVYEFLSDGALLRTLGTPGESGEDAAHFDQPTDVAFTSNGDIFIADGYGNARVVHFRGDGTFVNSWGGRGHRPGQFNLVHGIIADRRDRLLVADRNNARIQIFDASGHFLEQWCNLVIPWGMWMGPREEIWVCGSSPVAWRDDSYFLDTPPHDQILMKFNRDGRMLQLWEVPVGDKPGQLNWVHCVAQDSRGNLYCGDNKGQRMQKFDLVPAAEGSQP